MSRLKFIVARYDNDSFDGFLSESIQKYPHVFIKNDVANSIFDKYNLGVRYWKENGLQDNDVVVFIHADVKILDEDFEEKILYAFEKIPRLGVAGVIGSSEITENGGWWLSNPSAHKGEIVQWAEDGKSKFLMTKKKGNYHSLAGVDGLALFVMGHVARDLPFDSASYPESYDFYDLDYCLSVLSHGYKVAVLDIALEHKSAGTGVYKDSWKINKDRFIQKWKTAGVIFPFQVKEV